MTFKHTHFILYTEKRKVFDENNKELRLTGNAYRTLVFLCENGPSTVTDIGDYLDQAKNYNEDHLRQYRYKINSIVGHDIVKYENKVYFIDGDVIKKPKDDKQPINDQRITDLLRPDAIQLNNKSSYPMNKSILARINIFCSANKNTFAAILLTLVSYFFMAMGTLWIWIIPTIFAARKLLKAKKEKENKKFIFWSYLVVYSPVIIIVIYSCAFILGSLNNSKSGFSIVENKNDTSVESHENEVLQKKANCIIKKLDIIKKFPSYDQVSVFYNQKIDACLLAYVDYESSEDNIRYVPRHIIQNLTSGEIIYKETNFPEWEKTIEELKK